jgi:serine/threonine protein kinase
VSEDLHLGQALGTVFEGLWRIVARLGQGGMDTVYEAIRLRLHKRVAVKMMARELAERREALGRFNREAMTTSALSHPHIVRVMDSCANLCKVVHEPPPPLASKVVDLPGDVEDVLRCLTIRVSSFIERRRVAVTPMASETIGRVARMEF